MNMTADVVILQETKILISFQSLNEQFERHALPASEIATLLLGIIVFWGRRLLDRVGNVG